MSQNYLSGPGLGLPFPQALYPVSLSGANPTAATNEISLAPGQALPVPGGDWFIKLDSYTLLQFLDPVTGVWLPFDTVGGVAQVHSDGQNMRVANLTGTPIGAVVTAGGSNYVQASTTVTASAGGSTWRAIVGGALNTSVTVNDGGSGYTLPPVVFIPAPTNTASGYGVQATAVAHISAGAVTSIEIKNQGAGYATAPTLTILPAPNDPNVGSIVNATATCTLTGSGAVTAVLCTGNGAPVTSAPTLTVSGVGSSATALATMCWTTMDATISSGGAGYTGTALITSVGGVPTSTPAYRNPSIQEGILRPRPAQLGGHQTAGVIDSVTIYDPGMFASGPATLVLATEFGSSAASIALDLGSAASTIWMQPL